MAVEPHKRTHIYYKIVQCASRDVHRGSLYSGAKEREKPLNVREKKKKEEKKKKKEEASRKRRTKGEAKRSQLRQLPARLFRKAIAFCSSARLSTRENPSSFLFAPSNALFGICEESTAFGAAAVVGLMVLYIYLML